MSESEDIAVIHGATSPSTRPQRNTRRSSRGRNSKNDDSIDNDDGMKAKDGRIIPDTKIGATKTTAVEDDDDAKSRNKKEDKKEANGITTKNSEEKKNVSSTKSDNDDVANGEDDDSSSEEDELIACCLCHCSVDYADREAFFGSGGTSSSNNSSTSSSSNSSSDAASGRASSSCSAKAKKAGESVGAKGERKCDNNNVANNSVSVDEDGLPLLPKQLYDVNNNLLFCDGCDRVYHQRCHFVPVLKIPSGKWYCLICKYQKEYLAPNSSKVSSPPPKLPPAVTAKEKSTPKSTKKDETTVTKSTSKNGAKSNETPELSTNTSKRRKLSTKGKRLSKTAPSATSNDTPPKALSVKKKLSTKAKRLSKERTAPEDAESENATKSKKDKKKLTTRAKGLSSTPKNVATVKGPKSNDNSTQVNKKKKRLSAGKRHQPQRRSLSNIQLKLIFNSPPSWTATANNNENNFQPPEKEKILEWQRIFEFETKKLKSQQWKNELSTRMKSSLQGQLGQIRLAQDTLRSYTSTQRARQFLGNDAFRLQELSQTCVRLANGKLKIRQSFQALHQVLIGPQKEWMVLNHWLKGEKQRFQQQQQPEVYNDLVLKWYPFGQHYSKRTIHRFDNAHSHVPCDAIIADTDMKTNEKNGDNAEQHVDGVPLEVVYKFAEKQTVQKSKLKNGVISKKSANTKASSPAGATMSEKNKRKDGVSETESDDDDMISLDDLQCCICFRGESTDDNDVLLCDGQHCFRAYHQNCVVPHVKSEDIQDEDEDWFCPICNAISHLLYDIQAEYMGHEWEERHHYHQHNHRKKHAAVDDDEYDDDSTVKSWENVDDVFPEAERELAIANKWKRGERDEETNNLISSVLGVTVKLDNDSGEISSEEDDEDDVDFDLEAFQSEKQRKKEEEESGDDGSSTNSSEATLQDMSSVECKIDRKELDALSLGSTNSDSEEESCGDEGNKSGSRGRKLPRRRTRARSSRASSADEGSDRPSVDVGTLDESNIVSGKRNRTKVDYRKLNDAMFGMIDDDEAVKKFDDRDDAFIHRVRKRTYSSSSSSSSNEDSSGSERSDNEEEESGGDKKSSASNKKHAASRKRSNPKNKSGNKKSHDTQTKKKSKPTKKEMKGQQIKRVVKRKILPSKSDGGDSYDSGENKVLKNSRKKKSTDTSNNTTRKSPTKSKLSSDGKSLRTEDEKKQIVQEFLDSPYKSVNKFVITRNEGKGKEDKEFLVGRSVYNWVNKWSSGMTPSKKDPAKMKKDAPEKSTTKSSQVSKKKAVAATTKNAPPKKKRQVTKHTKKNQAVVNAKRPTKPKKLNAKGLSDKSEENSTVATSEIE